MIDEAQFKKLTGIDARDDDLERVNCDRAGQPGHTHCGLNKYGMPALMGSRVKPLNYKEPEQ